ncbi:hypothetical protein JB92DRAFT_2829879 [Gautieria morchelliformis]|nr:hypothetical protein JB92DRAFT_2829879 [Gautieria morchelliformis]
MSHDRKTILITGATGRQGCAVISSLLSADATAQRYRILALTRNTASETSKALLSLSSGSDSGSELTLVKGDLDNPTSIRKIFEEAEGGIWGVFAVLAFPGLGANADGEERQGISLADLSLEFGVSHFVLSTSERGGGASDDILTLDGAAKVKIERHVKSLGTKGLKWTLLRPGFFMENFDGTIGKITAGVLKCGLQPTTKQQLIAADDIGHVAATVFRNPEAHSQKTIVVVGDVLTPKEQDVAYEKATGRHLPSVPNVVAKLILGLNSHTRDLISGIERIHRDRSAMDGGYDAVIQDIKEIHPGIMTFQEWAKRKDGVVAKRTKGWNQVSILALVLGKQ